MNKQDNTGKQERGQDYQAEDSYQTAIEQMRQEAISGGASTEEEMRDYIRVIFARARTNQAPERITDLQPGQRVSYPEDGQEILLTIQGSPDGRTVDALSEDGVETFLMSSDLANIQILKG